MKTFRYAFTRPSNYGATQFAFNVGSARRLAQAEANRSGKSITVQKKKVTPPYVVISEFTVHPKGAHSNPSPSALKGATILSVSRNKSGVVTALKVRLKPKARTTPTKKRPAPRRASTKRR